MKKIVMIPETLDERKKTWRRLLEKVDREQSNGYAFVGEWLRAGECPVARARQDVIQKWPLGRGLRRAV